VIEFTRKLESFIFTKMTKYKMPSLSLTIIRDSEIIYARGFGFSDIDSSTPTTPRTSYCVGSVTKAFTATAIMQLVERGLLSLDDSVSRYVSVIRDPEIKIHHLLTHTSGIPALGYAEMLIDTYYGFRTDSLLPVATPGEVLVFMSEYEEYPRYKPGERWFYLNEGYVVLGEIIEKISGLKYEEYVKREIAEKLQLEKFYFTREDYMRDSDKATPYYSNREGKLVRAEPIFGVSADGGLFTSPLDLVKFAYTLASRGRFNSTSILEEKSIELMEKPHVKLPYESPTSKYYGYGLIIHDKFAGEYKLIGHSGSVYVYTAYMGYLPEKRVAVALASNSSGYSLSLIGAYALALAAGISESKLDFLRVDRVVDRLEGVYVGYKNTVSVRVKRSGDSLLLEDLYERLPPLTLIPELIEEDYVRFYIVTLHTKTPIEFYIKGNTVTLVYDRYLLLKKQ